MIYVGMWRSNINIVLYYDIRDSLVPRMLVKHHDGVQNYPYFIKYTYDCKMFPFSKLAHLDLSNNVKSKKGEEAL